MNTIRTITSTKARTFDHVYWQFEWRHFSSFVHCRLSCLVGWFDVMDVIYISFISNVYVFQNMSAECSTNLYPNTVCQTGLHHCSITFIAMFDLIHSSHFVLLFALLSCVLALDITLGCRIWILNNINQTINHRNNILKFARNHSQVYQSYFAAPKNNQSVNSEAIFNN